MLQGPPLGRVARGGGRGGGKVGDTHGVLRRTVLISCIGNGWWLKCSQMLDIDEL